MIGRVVRGWRAHGLIAYLFGPGRHHEHTQQHTIASWDGCPHLHQPPQTALGRFDVGGLVAALTDPAAAAGVPQQPPAERDGGQRTQGPVWHCSLRTAPEDRELSDAEWSEVVADLLDRTGIAGRDDPGACRWVAVRHATDHVHVAAVLVRQDTLRRVHPRRDYHRVRETCLAAEQRYGLRPTTPADKTAPRTATRAEHEKAARNRREEPSRDRLRRIVRTAAARATGPDEFLALLAANGTVRVRTRRDVDGQLLGYAVAAGGDHIRWDTAEGDNPVWFGGRSLASDLSAPRLTERWASAPAPVGDQERLNVAEKRAVWAAAPETVDHARAAAADGHDVDGVAHATGDMLLILAHLHGDPQAALARAADEFERAARTPGRGQPAHWSRAAIELRATSWRLARTGGDRGRAVAALALVLALAGLVAEIAAWRAQRHQAAAAAAAHRASEALTTRAGELADKVPSRSSTSKPKSKPHKPATPQDQHKKPTRLGMQPAHLRPHVAAVPSATRGRAR
ncbi:relaxase/mobilization nuclease domain-containing protein [Amycolatopsis japonica]|uniref:relaxase/mobilization nuclease domain-containing protein n=1 Tax=Amycolatopsis japonica TaxID=208439 RepID=UPI00366C10B1